MINGKRVLAIIPARAGSKRLINKNILPLHGQPVIAWSIMAAKQSQYIDDVLVSTDCEQIASISRDYGAWLPFMRSAALATDTATSADVILSTLAQLQSLAYDYEIVLILQPTSPLRQAWHIDQALALMQTKEALGVVSVTQCEHSPLWSNTLAEDGNMAGFINQQANQRSQDLSPYYRLNGAIYAYDVDAYITNGNGFYTEQVQAYKMDNIYSVDIDTQLDFAIAETMFTQLEQEPSH